MTRDSALQRVTQVVEALLRERGVKSPPMDGETSLVDDLGLDSLDFVDLTLELERAFGREGFPMQDWADRQIAAGGRQFTVGDLTDACVEFFGSAA